MAPRYSGEANGVANGRTDGDEATHQYDHSRVQKYFGACLLHFMTMPHAVADSLSSRPPRFRRLFFLNSPTTALVPSVVRSTGGNSLESAPPSKVADFVRERGGHTVITKVRPLPVPLAGPSRVGALGADRGFSRILTFYRTSHRF